jgi:hypothetical protein
MADNMGDNSLLLANLSKKMTAWFTREGYILLRLCKVKEHLREGGALATSESPKTME